MRRAAVVPAFLAFVGVALGGCNPTNVAYCSHDIGLVTASDFPNVGPIETCTAQYPTCTQGGDPPIAGWQCCGPADAESGLSCMPNEAAAYQPVPGGE